MTELNVTLIFSIMVCLIDVLYSLVHALVYTWTFLRDDSLTDTVTHCLLLFQRTATCLFFSESQLYWDISELRTWHVRPKYVKVHWGLTESIKIKQIKLITVWSPSLYKEKIKRSTEESRNQRMTKTWALRLQSNLNLTTAGKTVDRNRKTEEETGPKWRCLLLLSRVKRLERVSRSKNGQTCSGHAGGLQETARLQTTQWSCKGNMFIYVFVSVHLLGIRLGVKLIMQVCCIDYSYLQPPVFQVLSAVRGTSKCCSYEKCTFTHRQPISNFNDSCDQSFMKN